MRVWAYIRLNVEAEVRKCLASRGSGLRLRVRGFGYMYCVRRVRGDDIGRRVKGLMGLRGCKVQSLRVRS